MRSISLQQLGTILSADVIGDGTTEIHGIAGIEEAGPGDISFVANPKYVNRISLCRASALIVGRHLSTEFRPLLVADDPYLAFTQALNILLGEQRQQRTGVHERAMVAADVSLGTGVSIMANASLESGVSVGDRSIIYPGVFVGSNTHIGADAVLYPNVTIGAETQIGDRVIIHGGTCLLMSETLKNPEGSRIILGDDVELGANVTITCGGKRDTIIGRGTKVDNLVGIRAGAQLGENCIVVAQCTIGEDATLEERVTLAGQVVICSGIHIGPRTTVGAKSYVDEDLPGGEAYSGTPAQPHSRERRLHAYLRRVPELRDRIEQLEHRFQERENQPG
ncbi:MAG: UDP-3-O-(3-hydroxymyristoyl)glucosamine N-acyltransferase [bacterium]